MSGNLTYKQSGVDTIQAQSFVHDISAHVKRTQKNRQLCNAFGLFAAAYDLSSYKEPVIVTGTDGVGTKTEILFELDMLETAGKDLVAMNVNDILTTGGDPLVFLDYLGISNLQKEQPRITRLVAGMCDYLESCNCILAGGETAEMPGVVPEDLVEMAGFSIGCVEKSEMIQPATVEVGDVLVGYPSDGFHANGWSLIRRILKQTPDLLSEQELRGILAPTRLYHDVVYDMRKLGVTPKAYAHITGGGFPDNIPRVLPKCVNAEIDRSTWEVPTIFKFIQNQGKVDREEMYRVFNMGIGFVVIIPKKDLKKATNVLKAQHQPYSVIGVIRKGKGIVTYKN